MLIKYKNKYSNNKASKNKPYNLKVVNHSKY